MAHTTIAVLIGLFVTACAGTRDTAAEPKADEKFERFSKLLTGSKLVGHFTVLGKEDAAPEKEEYHIESVTKTKKGDYWLFKVRVKYGTMDVTLPMVLQVKWADDTPVITLTDTTIPLLGTFSARVVIYNNKYAGTWTHDKVGGHLYGTVQKAKE